MAKRTIEPPENQESSSYLRSRRPVRVRRGLRDWRRLPLRWIAAGLAVLIVSGSVAYAIDGYLESSQRFRLPGDGSGLRLTGLQFAESDAVKRIFEQDFGAALLAIPLEERRRQVLEIPWIEDAAIARVWPDRLWLHARERTPLAFVHLPAGKSRTGAKPKLIDRQGVFLDPPAAAQFSLPVIKGIQPSMPADERLKRLALFEALMAGLDGGEPRYSPQVSEVDLSDTQNAVVSTVHEGEIVDLQMGNEHFRHRYELFLKYFPSWKQEFGTIRSVDLRFKGHVAIQ